MLRKKDYVDMEKYHRTVKRQKQRYYGKTAFLYPSRPWTTTEENLVLNHEFTDTEL